VEDQTMMTVANTLGLVLGLAVLFVPLSLLWAYALYDSVRGALVRRSEPSELAKSPELSVAEAPLGWPALLLLTGFFGGIAYLFLVLLPRLQRARTRVRLGALGTA
jgi:hypothetical protein